MTNAALNALVPFYRSAGLDAGETARRVTALLPPVYDGDLRSYGHLLKRIESYYRNAPDPKPRSVQRSLFASPAGEAVASLWHGHNRDSRQEEKSDAHIRTYPVTRQGQGSYQIEKGRTSIRRLVNGILEWHEYIAGIRSSPIEKSTCAYLYPYFAANTRKGYTPLPWTVLRRIDANYHRFLPFLIASGFLVKAPFQYVPGAGICNYYRICINRFVSVSFDQNTQGKPASDLVPNPDGEQ